LQREHGENPTPTKENPDEVLKQRGKEKLGKLIEKKQEQKNPLYSQ
jgi:hypothetical protein